MTWFDRLQKAAYTSPSGLNLEFIFEDVSVVNEKKTSQHDLASSNGTFIQDLGRKSRRFPMNIILNGTDYDLDASQFETMLLETGIGKLQHPIYGTLNVIPTGVITRNDRLKTRANEASITVEFWESIDILTPIATNNPVGTTLNEVDSFNTTVPDSFVNVVSLIKSVERAIFSNRYLRLLNRARSEFINISNASLNFRIRFENTFNSISNSIDLLLDAPATLAAQTIQLIQIPALVGSSASDSIVPASINPSTTNLIAPTNLGVTSIDVQRNILGSPVPTELKINTYSALIDEFTTEIQTPSLDSEPENNFRTDELFVTLLLSGLVLSVTVSSLNTRSEAIDAIDVILAKFAQYITWRDNNIQSLGFTDTGDIYQPTLDLIGISASSLVATSFTLKQERTLTLDKDRTIIDLVAELYGSVDDQIDFFINSNKLTGEEIWELKRGRQVTYYV